MVIKFDQDVSCSFYAAAKDFVIFFGPQAINSLIIICIQVNTAATEYSDSEFEQFVFNRSDGARYLAEQNGESQRVQCCQWDNMNHKCPAQRKNSQKTATVTRPKFEKSMMQ